MKNERDFIRPRIAKYDGELLVVILGMIQDIPEVRGFFNSNQLKTVEDLKVKFTELLAVSRARGIVRGYEEPNEDSFQRVLAQLEANGYDTTELRSHPIPKDQSTP